VIDPVLQIIHSRFGDGPGWGVVRSGLSPRQGTLEPRRRLASCCCSRPCTPAGRGPSRRRARRARAAGLGCWRRSPGSDPRESCASHRRSSAIPATAFAAHRPRDAGYRHDPDVAVALVPLAGFGGWKRSCGSGERHGHLGAEPGRCLLEPSKHPFLLRSETRAARVSRWPARSRCARLANLRAATGAEGLSCFGDSAGSPPGTRGRSQAWRSTSQPRASRARRAIVSCRSVLAGRAAHG
jgi:hypothetical protein